MKILVIGGGGREHALVWKLAQSRRVSKLYAAPGNGGIAQLAELVDIGPEQTADLVQWAEEHRIDLTIVGPENALAAGIVDAFTERQLPIFGPTQAAAQLEASKAFSKEFCTRHSIPTAPFAVFEDAAAAKAHIKQHGVPIVVKADGLCAGKGTIVATTMSEALGAVTLMMEDRLFGEAGSRVVIEEMLVGEEVSVIALIDGRSAVILPSAQDHKRLQEGDKGPNTGGMGAYSPAPVLTPALLQTIQTQVIAPALAGLQQERLTFCGILYAGIMVTARGPLVLEFNVRLGDPEAQVILPRLQTDLIDVCEAALAGRLSDVRLEWDPRSCVTVVAASKGYPGDYERGKLITGLQAAMDAPDVLVFHGGTKREGQQYFTWGGRVLNVVALDAELEQALKKAYGALERVQFDGMQFRRDIGWRAARHPARSR